MGRIRRYSFHVDARIRQPTTHVLLVDDDPHAADRYRDALTEHGADVTTVASVEAALEALERNTFDLVLVDYLLHGFHGPTGLEVAEAAHRMGPRTSLYVMALHPRGVPRDTATAAGVAGILDKAFLSRDDLRQLLLDVQLGRDVAAIPACWSTRTARYEA